MKFTIFIPKLYNGMKEYIKKMLSGKDDTSSKRFAGIFTMINAVWIGYITPKYSIPQYVFEGLLMFSASMLGATLFEGMFNKNKTNSTSTTTEVKVKEETKESTE